MDSAAGNHVEVADFIDFTEIGNDPGSQRHAANGIQLGASPRASLALMKTAQALALSEGREFVIPEDVREMAVPVIAHRMVVEPQARFAGVTTVGLVEEILAKVPMPS